MDNVVTPRVGMAVRTITGSSGRRPWSMVQNLDQKDFTGNAEKTPRMSSSCGMDLNVDQDENDETGKVRNFEDGNWLAVEKATGWKWTVKNAVFEMEWDEKKCYPRGYCNIEKLQLSNNFDSELLKIVLVSIYWCVNCCFWSLRRLWNPSFFRTLHLRRTSFN